MSVLPKAEIHCHLEGAANPTLVKKQARKYGADVSAFIQDDAYVWNDFTSFLNAYDLASGLFRNEADYALLTGDYLTGIARDGAIYAELFISTDHAKSAGVDPQAYVEGIAEGIKQAKTDSGIEARIIATGVRHLGKEAVEDAARWIAQNPHPLITGFGMGGDERMHEKADFAKAFDIARDAGLGITVHAGEFGGAPSVRDALDHLRPARIGHGVRAIEDPALVERLAEEQIVLETCPGSNISLGVYPDFAAHPFAALHKAGCLVTLNSDDPPFFHTSLASEYEIAEQHFGLDKVALLELTRTAIQAGFIDGDTRARLLERCDQSGIV